MDLKIQVTILSIILLFVMNSCICRKEIYKSGKEKFINLAAVSNYVFIGGSQTIILLNSSLKVLNRQTVKSETEYPLNWLMIPYGNIIVVCNYRYKPPEVPETLCLNYKVNTDDKYKLEIIEGSSASYFEIGGPFADFIPIIAENVKSQTVLFVASSKCLNPVDQKCIAIGSYLFQGGIKEFSVNNLDYRVFYKKGQHVNFKAVFKTGTFIYFIFNVNSTHSKLGKICTDLNKQPLVTRNSYEDIPIFCQHYSKLYTAAMDAVFWSEQKYLFVTFSDDSTSVMCRYELRNIQKKFMEARKDRLKCPLQVNLNNYFELQYLNYETVSWCFNNTSEMCEIKSEKTNQSKICPEVNDDQNGFCSTELFGSVEGNLPLVSGEVTYSRDHVDTGAIVKVAAITRNKYAVIYAGTKTGKLGKIFVQETLHETSFENLETIDNSFPILDIKINGENVYAMTENLVVKVGDTEDCPTSGGCEGCMQSQNPFCGWDVLQNRCNKNNSQPFWVPSAGRKCLKLIPKDVKVNDKVGSSSENTVIFIVEPDVFIPDDDTICRINNRTEYKVQNYTCGPFTFSESGKINMALMYNNIPVVDATLNVYKCPDFKGCTECVRGRLCFWCPKEFSCVTNALSCSGAVHNDKSMCPRIGNSQSLFVTKNSGENVTMYVPQFAVYNESREHNLFRCVVNANKSNMAAEVYRYNIAAKGDNVTCIDVNIGNNAVISLEYNSSYQLDNSAKLEVYQCQSLNAGKKCGYCKYLRSQNYKCDWCGKRCYSTLMNNNQHLCVDKCDEDIGTNLRVYPPSGPDNGGTVITITGDNLGNHGDNISVTIYGVECTPVNVIEPSSKLNCTTGKNVSTGNNDLTISVNGQNSVYLASKYYRYEELVVGLIFEPSRSIQSGGRRVFITGNNSYFNDADDSRFKVSFCNNICISCRGVKSEGGKTITCKMDKSDQAMELTKLKVIVDTNTTIELLKSFNIVENPTINDMSPESDKVFRSGGAKITIKGQGFSDIDIVRIEDVVNQCKIQSNTSVECETPPYVKSDYDRRRRSTGQNVKITYDDYAYPSKIYYVEDPVIDDFLSLMEYTAGSGSSIVITGKNLLEGANKDDYIVHIGLSGLCFVEDINSENITCQPPSAVPRTNHSDANIVYVLVQVGLIRRHVGFLKYNKDIEVPVTIILISVLSAVVAGAIFTISAIIFIMKRKKKIAEKNFQMELLTREENIRQASREEFADAQMTIRDIKSDLVTSRVPFFDYQTYVFNQLFPNQDINNHPLLQEPMSTDDSKYRVTEALVMFDKLMTNKLFLKSVVQTLENQKGLSMQDKAHFACTLSVAFLGNMRLFYELVSCLLSDMIQSAPKKQHKVLFRRFDSITQRLMVNWLELSLYDHLKKQSGMQLFMLYKATQTVIEKGPIDAVTNHCRNTLAEERLLKNRVECETLTLNIDLNGNSDNHIPVTVLDCDTITQVKHKCITAIYKNKPASEIPTPNELELEWHHGRSGKLILQDKDKISDRSNGMVRLNTLKHYLVKNGSEMALMYKELLEDEPELYENQVVANAQFSSPDYVKLLIPDSLDEKNQDLHQWHLSNLTDEEKSQDYEIGELFLNRLFHTKLILRDYIDVTFEGILDPESLSVPVQYFLCMIDKQAKAVGVDSTVVQSWKSECYATRVWASLISRPQILFDVVVPSHVEPCMDILKQVFIDIFTHDAQNVSKDSSTQKLLFFKDVPEYRKHVDLFFSRVKGVSDQEFWRAIDEISSVQSREIKFNRQATLHQLYNIIAKYKDEIIEGFGANDETKDLDFGNKLEKVSEKMEE